MPVKSKKVTYEYTLDEVKELFIESLGKDDKSSAVDIQFIITHTPENFDGPGIPILSRVIVTLTPKDPQGDWFRGKMYSGHD
jgi:hypothetical protein